MRLVSAAVPLLVMVGCVGDQQITKHNATPEARITSHLDGDTVEVGLPVTFRGQISDEDDGTDLLVATWFSGPDVLCAEAPVGEDGSTYCEAVLDAADTTIVLEGRDPEDDVGTATVEIVPVVSGTPQAEITSPEGGRRYYSDQEIAVTATVSDAEDGADALEVVWTDEAGAEVEINGPDGDGRISDAIRLPEGSHTLTITVTDSTGKAGVDSVAVEVGGPDQPPQCAITLPADGASAPDGAVRLEGTASDPEQAPETLVAEWSSDLQGALGNSAVDAAGLAGLDAALDRGTHRITMRVADEVGAECVAEILFTVGTPPTVEIVAPLMGAMFNEGEEIVFEGRVGSAGYAPEDLIVGWESDVDGALGGDPADASGAAWLTAGLSAGPHAVTLRATDPDGLYAEAWTEVWINGLPTMPVVEIQPGLPLTGDDLAAVVAVDATDPEGDAISYRYAWYRDGALTAWAADTVPASETARGEVWSVEVVPEDGMGAGPAGSASVTIGNTAPVLAGADLGPTDAAEGDALTCTPGATSDADGDAAGLSYGWEVNGLSVAATGAQLGDTWWAAGDVVTCVVTPDDGIDAGAAVRSNAVTIRNSAPTATGAEITPDPAYAGDALVCALAGYADADADMDQSVYAWTVNGAAAGVGDTLVGGFVGGDAVVCEVLPFDGSDYGAAVSAAITVADSAPVLASVALTPAAPLEGDVLTCAPGPTSDADGTTAFSYGYAWTVNGAIIAATGSTLTGAEFDRGDTVRCAVTPSDGIVQGAAVSSAAVTVGNTAPQVSGASISPSAPTEASVLSVSVSAADADGDGVNLSYAWHVNGAMVSTSATLSGASFRAGDAVYAVVTPDDGTDAGAAYTTAPVTVANTAPTLAAASITPDPAYTTDTLTCAGVGFSDADGDADQTIYAWTVDGAAAGSGPTLAGAFHGGSAVVCTATPCDGQSCGTAVTDAVTIRNTAPTMTSAGLTPTTAYEATTLTCAGAGSDADGDPLSYSYAWYVNGSLIAATTATLTGTYFSRGNTVYCAATANDGLASSAPLSSNTVTISNTAPTLTSVGLTPATAYEASTLTCAPVGSDADGDTLSYTYAWTVNGAAIAPTTSTLTGAYFSRGSVVACSAVASDGAASSASLASSSVTIQNTAPVTTGAGLTPTTAYEASTLTCAGTGTDADGDAVSYTYAWYVNGSLIAPTGSTLTGTYFSRGSSVYCRATATDGSASGSAATSNTVTISNTAPTMTSVSLTPTTAYEASTLTCTPSGSDADGDALSYSYAWYVNGGLITPTTSTLTGAYFSRGNTVYCAATVSDGLASSSLSSSSVTVSNTAPVISSVSLTPTTAYEGSTLTCAPSGSDADGDAVSYSYAWYVNGSLIAATGSTLTGTYFSKTNTVYCRATPSDGTVAGSAVSSSSVTISNSAPTAPTVAIDPTAPEAGVDDLWCDVTTASTDADGDALSYAFAWTRNGAAWTGATSTTTRTGDTIGIASLTAGDSWRCSATASDGAATSSAGTSTVSVLAASYTIGYYDAFPSPGTGSTAANYNLGQQITVSSAVQLYQLGVRMRLADTDLGRMALYTNSGGAPGTLVAYTNLTALPAGPVDMDVVGGPISVSAGTYWIMMNFSGTVYTGYTNTGASANTLYYNALSSSSPFPTTYGSGSTYTGQFINLYMVVR